MTWKALTPWEKGVIIGAVPWLLLAGILHGLLFITVASMSGVDRLMTIWEKYRAPREP